MYVGNNLRKRSTHGFGNRNKISGHVIKGGDRPHKECMSTMVDK